MTSIRTFLSSPAIPLCGQDARLRFPATKYDVDDTTMTVSLAELFFIFIFYDFQKWIMSRSELDIYNFPLFPKIKEVNFKTINNIYPCSESLSVSCNLESNNCTFCQ